MPKTNQLKYKMSNFPKYCVSPSPPPRRGFMYLLFCVNLFYPVRELVFPFASLLTLLQSIEIICYGLWRSNFQHMSMVLPPQSPITREKAGHKCHNFQFHRYRPNVDTTMRETIKIEFLNFISEFAKPRGGKGFPLCEKLWGQPLISTEHVQIISADDNNSLALKLIFTKKNSRTFAAKGCWPARL